MRVLVTGHKGYIGTVIVPMFVAEGHEVVGLDNCLFEECTCDVLPAEVPEIRKDVRDIDASDLEGFDAIVHLAGLSNDPLGGLDGALTYEINFQAAARMAKMAKDVGVGRFLNSSSCSVYGTSGDAMIDETGRLEPITAYAQSKVMLDQELSRLSDDNFTTAYLRNATAYGFSPRLRLDLVLNDFVAAAYTTGRILIKSDGTPWRPIVHIEDIGRAFLALLEAPAGTVNNQAFNIGVNSENYQIRDLADMVREVVPGCVVEYAKDGGPDKRCYRVDCSKIQRMVPGFEPQWNAKMGAMQLYDAYRRIGLSKEDLDGPRYKRLAVVKKLMDSGILDSRLHRTDDQPAFAAAL